MCHLCRQSYYAGCCNGVVEGTDVGRRFWNRSSVSELAFVWNLAVAMQSPSCYTWIPGGFRAFSRSQPEAPQVKTTIGRTPSCMTCRTRHPSQINCAEAFTSSKNEKPMLLDPISPVKLSSVELRGAGTSQMYGFTVTASERSRSCASCLQWPPPWPCKASSSKGSDFRCQVDGTGIEGSRRDITPVLGLGGRRRGSQGPRLT